MDSMRLIKDVRQRPAGDEFAGEVRVNGSICYDFVVSLRAMFNPRTFAKSRRWSAVQLPRLDDKVVEKGEFFFAGFDTALGYGAARVIASLADDAAPGDLIGALEQMPAAELAVFMLDTGETSTERLKLFDEVLAGETSKVDAAVSGLPVGWAGRCRHVLTDPERARTDLVQVFQAHLERVYGDHIGAITRSIDDAIPTALKTLDLLPAFEAIERLTGGYTLGSDLGLRTITLAPSVFIHPFMSTRVDEEAGEALILFGIPSSIFDDYDPEQTGGELMPALKAMADPSRLTVLHLLAQQPLYTSEVVERLRLAQTTVHHHLAQLRAAGLIRQERDRKGMKYSIRTDSARQVLRALDDWILNPDQEDTPKEARP
jgi:DNA-binding transcriptional ArsR family regulator